MPALEEEVGRLRELCKQAMVQQRALYDTKVDISTLQSHQDAFAAGQEQLSMQFSDDISSVLGKLEASAGGFHVLHKSIAELVGQGGSGRARRASSTTLGAGRVSCSVPTIGQVP